MQADKTIMPDGTEFDFWDDTTAYAKTYHVACKHSEASDENPGTEESPFVTIGQAAGLLQPGEKVIVHEGVYRQHVRPARGGEGPDRMIAYEAAPGDEVIIKGSEIIQTPFTPSRGWRGIEQEKGKTNIWMADLPEQWFVGYNPFGRRNMFNHYLTFIGDWSEAETHCLLKRRAMVFADGRRLQQVYWPRELAETQGAFWVEEPGLRIHVRLQDDADPNEITIEATAREQVFAPRVRHLGYIRVSGFRIEHAADGFPVPQRAMVSSSRGHHWIIEDCEIRWANSTGIDLGREDWGAVSHDPRGRHIIRRNTIADCGACGITGADCVDGSLIEDNLIEGIGWHDIERLLECAGLKFHEAANVLIRRNVFRHIKDAGGVWLDVLNSNCRVTRNIFADIETFTAGMFLECSHEPNLIDGNIFWDIRNASCLRSEDARQHMGGTAFNADACDNATVVHNLFANVPDHYAAAIHLRQHDRIIGRQHGHEPGGRAGLCRRHKFLNNAFVNCPQQILLGRSEENISDGNLFDVNHDTACIRVDHPSPQTFQNFEGWREYYGQDANSTRTGIAAEFDAETLTLTLKVDGDLPQSQEVTELYGVGEYVGAGPLRESECKELVAGKTISVTYDLPGAGMKGRKV